MCYIMCRLVSKGAPAPYFTEVEGGVGVGNTS